jgi:formate dehydrogenase-N alpha subunit
MSWSYKQPDHPESEEVAKENNGYALADLYDSNGVCWRKRPAVEQLRAAAR